MKLLRSSPAEGKPTTLSRRSLAALVTSGLTLTGAFVLASPASPVLAAAGTCATFEFVGVAGSGELQNGSANRKSLWMGMTVKGLYDKVQRRYRDSTTTISPYGVRYAAIPVDLNPIHADVYVKDYGQSVRQGADNLKLELNRAAVACPAQQFILAGYSQGADVAKTTLGEISDEVRGRVRAMLLFGDPRYNPQNSVENVGNPTTGTRSGIMTTLTGNPGEVDPPDVQARTRSYCDALDVICQGLPNQIRGDLPHYHYGDWATTPAADFLVSIEAPAGCPISTATWSVGKGITSTSPAIVMSTGFGGDQPVARAAPGFRFVGFVAVGDWFTPDLTSTATMRIDQSSLAVSDTNYPDQNVLTISSPAHGSGVFYAQARAVPANCGDGGGRLTIAIQAASEREVRISGRLTFGGRPLGGATVMWEVLDPANPDGGFGSVDFLFNGHTGRDGRWSLDARGTSKPILAPGIYRMRLAFAGDVNHREVVSRAVRVTVPQAS